MDNLWIFGKFYCILTLTLLSRKSVIAFYNSGFFWFLVQDFNISDIFNKTQTQTQDWFSQSSNSSVESGSPNQVRHLCVL